MRARRAFTLIELLVVIAIIAILAAILFPVFSRAKESAKQAAGLSQMRQLAAAAIMYATDQDDAMVPATNYGVPADSPMRLWSPIVLPYAAGREVFVVPGSTARFAEGWSTRNQQNVGMNGATAYDPIGCTEGQPDTTGCEGFTSTTTFSAADEAARTALFAITPHGPLADKYRGYVFSPYNSFTHAQDKRLSPPLVSDRDLVRELSNLPPSQLKPVLGYFGKTGRDDGITPVVFADGHVKAYSAKSIRNGNSIIWRFR